MPARCSWCGTRIAHQLGVNDVNFAIRTTGLIGLIVHHAGARDHAAAHAHRLEPAHRDPPQPRRDRVLLPRGCTSDLLLVRSRAQRPSTLHRDRHARVSVVRVRRARADDPARAHVDRRDGQLGSARSAGSCCSGWPTSWRSPASSTTTCSSSPTRASRSRSRSSSRALLAVSAWSRTTSACAARCRAARGKLRRRTPTPKKKTFWSGELEIARIFDETHDVKTFRLVSPDGGPLPFTHVAGQYLNLALTIDGKRVNRSYTIASSPTRSAYCEISVKRAADGYGSQPPARDVARGRARQGLGAGRQVRLRGPRGRARRADRRRHRHHADDVGRAQPDRPRLARRDLPVVLGAQARATSCSATSSPICRRGFRTCTCWSRSPTIRTRRGTARAARSRATLDRALRARTRRAARSCCAAPTAMMTAMRALLVGMGVPDARGPSGGVRLAAAVEPSASAAHATTTRRCRRRDGDHHVRARRQDRARLAERRPCSRPPRKPASRSRSSAAPASAGSARRAWFRKVRDGRPGRADAARSREGAVLACQARATRDCAVDA